MPSYVFYIDETGNRNPNHKPDLGRQNRDWFAIGGILVKAEDIEACKAKRQSFVEKWGIKSPLHMTDMHGCHKAFSWLGRLTDEAHDAFWSDYKGMLASLPVIGLACVIDRPGYVARGYLNAHADPWLLCRSAFDISVERATKIAIRDGRKLSVVFEADVGINAIIKGYFKNLKENGLGFDGGRSGKYEPLSVEQFQATLSTIESKNKDNPMLQIADTYLYAIARQAYDKQFHVFKRLRDSRRIANFALTNEEIPHMGIKYYCFD